MTRLLLPILVLACAPPALVADDSFIRPPAPESSDAARPARDLFKQGKFAEAAAQFAALKGQAPLTADDAATWAFCRVRVAADALTRPGCDTAAVAADVADALKLAPAHAELQKVGQAVLAVARQKAAGGAAPADGCGPAVPDGWETIETPSFTVRFTGTREVAEAVAKAAEAKRAETFTRWSGPPGAAWSPRCEVVLHPTAEDYAKTTGKPAAATGHATVRLADGVATGRRIDLRADDAGAVDNALPRELTHVVLADLFPHTPPPKWAEEGMAVLAGSADETDRYARTLTRCYGQGELYTLAVLLELKDYPAAEKVTGFCCGSVSLVEFLVKRGGEKNFTIFLRDCQRYGSASALKRQYGFDSPKALQEAWLRATFAATP